MTETELVRYYTDKIKKLKAYKAVSLETLREDKSKITLELEIASRIGHNVQEEFIRAKLENILTSIDIIEGFDLSLPYKKKLDDGDI